MTEGFGVLAGMGVFVFCFFAGCALLRYVIAKYE